jgi:hypothetical protein
MSRRSVPFAILIVCLSPYVLAVQVEPTVLRWSADVLHGDTAAGSNAVRIYESPTELVLKFVVRNDGAQRVAFTTETLGSQVAFSMGADEALLAKWQPTVRWSYGQLQQSVPPTEFVSIEPRQEVEWTVIVRRSDQRPFGRGTNRLRIAAGDLPLPLVASGVESVIPLLPASRSIAVTNGPPADTPVERAAAGRQLGRRALSEGRVDDAIAAFEAAVQAEPTSRVSHINLSDAYLEAGRFSDALPLLRKVIQARPLERSPLRLQLALAYLGSGNEAEARDALRAAGFEVERVDREIEKLRERLSRP